MTKKRSSEIFVTKANFFYGKGDIGEIFVQCENFSDGRPCCLPR